MRAILAFSLPKEEEAHRQALHGQDYHSVIADHREWFRTQLKYADLGDETRAVLEAGWQELLDSLSAYHVTDDFE